MYTDKINYRSQFIRVRKNVILAFHDSTRSNLYLINVVIMLNGSSGKVLHSLEIYLTALLLLITQDVWKLGGKNLE